jgi:hypothetical protein
LTFLTSIEYRDPCGKGADPNGKKYKDRADEELLSDGIAPHCARKMSSCCALPVQLGSQQRFKELTNSAYQYILIPCRRMMMRATARETTPARMGGQPQQVRAAVLSLQ